ncbi:gamma-glutamylcyclotransferase family protein [Metamycoplasma equirhinis]|uniref:Gamma-glutamylcyclotransferase family protein n=1 Tax=Metamycoplasma equirhinis TaxID=92402 RepID=A0ABZ0PBA6_9BACT|nr:gamma-glutamylcyclotransferase family protein [Metamycoplasma equirhinis]TPD97751.1 gamma-glutamylcyclotransferase [Metamycoplasma equirhinis]WPB54185.1 gamma-glutamylcyclotransferase family protein [Metamycoplasma equirhinis]
MNNKKIKVFVYDAIVKAENFLAMFGLKIKNEPAKLAGYKSFFNRDKDVFIKKDYSSIVDGVLLELDEANLKRLDKWYLFPYFDRIMLNVLDENNQIVENVYVYSKIVSLEDCISFDSLINPEDKAKIFNGVHENLLKFLEAEKKTKNLPFHDVVFLYELSNEQMQQFKNYKYPYVYIVNKEFKYNIPAMFLPVTINGFEYLALVAFYRQEQLKAIDYKSFFEKHQIFEFASKYKNVDVSILNTTRPFQYLVTSENTALSSEQIATHENTFELMTFDFQLNPWNRFNYLIGVFDQIENSN